METKPTGVSQGSMRAMALILPVVAILVHRGRLPRHPPEDIPPVSREIVRTPLTGRISEKVRFDCAKIIQYEFLYVDGVRTLWTIII